MQRDGEARQQTPTDRQAGRQAGRQNKCLTISLSSVTSSTGALTLHLLRLHHLREKTSPLCETDVSWLTAEQNAYVFDESEAPVVTVRAARWTEKEGN